MVGGPKSPADAVYRKRPDGRESLGRKTVRERDWKEGGVLGRRGGIREVEIWTSKVMEGGASVESKICTMAKIDHVHPLSSPNEEGGGRNRDLRKIKREEKRTNGYVRTVY